MIFVSDFFAKKLYAQEKRQIGHQPQIHSSKSDVMTLGKQQRPRLEQWPPEARKQEE